MRGSLFPLLPGDKISGREGSPDHTGKVCARSFTVAPDCGLIINPDELRRCIEGNCRPRHERALSEDRFRQRRSPPPTGRPPRSATPPRRSSRVKARIVEAHPFALGALGEPAMERFRRAQLPFAAVAFGRFDGGRRDPAGGPRTKRKPKRRLLIRKWYRPCADVPGNASWLSANGTPDPFPNVRGGRKWHSLDLCLDLERDHQSPCQYVIAGALLMSIL